jgi:uracil-DNA glycosylase
MTAQKININKDWETFLRKELDSSLFQSILNTIKNERKTYNIFPKDNDIFNAFNYTKLDNLKVVILGQDPYHGRGQAHGLSFSVPNNMKTPPSLKNIFKELNTDLELPISKSGNLEKWAKQGVLLLNSTLTVREKEPGSHQKIGWEELTDSIITKISNDKSGIIFLLWGKFAQEKSMLINNKKHYILTAAHPSPFSAYRGFFGCKHFSKTNEILKQNNQTPIDWKLCENTLTLF